MSHQVLLHKKILRKIDGLPQYLHSHADILLDGIGLLVQLVKVEAR